MRARSQLAVALLDIDRCKGIDDTYGHLTGDEVLKEIARSSRCCCGRDQVQMISTTRGLSAVSSIPRSAAGAHAPSLFRRASVS